MRHLCCMSCGSTTDSEAEEMEAEGFKTRIVLGIAKQPQDSQRIITVHTVSDIVETQLDPSYYNCDRCNAEIKPGDKCVAFTASRFGVLPDWEHEFMRIIKR